MFSYFFLFTLLSVTIFRRIEFALNFLYPLVLVRTEVISMPLSLC